LGAFAARGQPEPRHRQAISVGHARLPRLPRRLRDPAAAGYLVDLRDGQRKSPQSIVTRHGQLRTFIHWLVEEGELPQNPMARVRPPKGEMSDPPLMREEMVRALLTACAGNGFLERRDAAIARLLFDTGMRAGALASIQLADLDLDERIVTIHTKGRKAYAVPFGAKTAAALDRYLRVRARHRYTDLSALWLGQNGEMHYEGIHRTLNRRAKAAGIGHIHQHMFRHGFAHAWLSAGGQEGDLMAIAGWQSRDVMTRYARLTKQQRARDAHKQLSPGDRL
jgi:site-specific recombinase XerC